MQPETLPCGLAYTVPLIGVWIESREAFCVAKMNLCKVPTHALWDCEGRGVAAQSLQPCKPPELSWGLFQKQGQVNTVGSPIEPLPGKQLWQGRGATKRARWDLRIRPAPHLVPCKLVVLSPLVQG